MRTIMVLGTLMLSSFTGQAQKNYAVMVSDAKTAKPIAGASVKILSTGTTVTTGESGNVVIFAPPDDSLHIQFKGYKDRKISLVDQSQAISIVMDPKTSKAPVARKPKKRQ